MKRRPPQSALTRSTDGGSGRLEHGANSTPPPCWTGRGVIRRATIVLHKEIPGMGRAKRYIMTIADDDRAPLDKLCQKLIAADATCDVLRNPIRQDQ